MGDMAVRRARPAGHLHPASLRLPPVATRARHGGDECCGWAGGRCVAVPTDAARVLPRHVCALPLASRHPGCRAGQRGHLGRGRRQPQPAPTGDRLHPVGHLSRRLAADRKGRSAPLVACATHLPLGLRTRFVALCGRLIRRVCARPPAGPATHAKPGLSCRGAYRRPRDRRSGHSRRPSTRAHALRDLAGQPIHPGVAAHADHGSVGGRNPADGSRRHDCVAARQRARQVDPPVVVALCHGFDLDVRQDNRGRGHPRCPALRRSAATSGASSSGSSPCRATSAHGGVIGQYLARGRDGPRYRVRTGEGAQRLRRLPCCPTTRHRGAGTWTLWGGGSCTSIPMSGRPWTLARRSTAPSTSANTSEQSVDIPAGRKRCRPRERGSPSSAKTDRCWRGSLTRTVGEKWRVRRNTCSWRHREQDRLGTVHGSADTRWRSTTATWWARGLGAHRCLGLCPLVLAARQGLPDSRSQTRSGTFAPVISCVPPGSSPARNPGHRSAVTHGFCTNGCPNWRSPRRTHRRGCLESRGSGS